MSSTRNNRLPSRRQSSQDYVPEGELTNILPIAYSPSSFQDRSQTTFVDLTTSNGAQHNHQHRSGTSRRSDLGSARRGPRFANDIIVVDGASAESRSHNSVNRSTSQIDDDGFEIVGEREIPPHLRAPQPGPQRLGPLNAAQRTMVGNLMSRLARVPSLSFLTPMLDYEAVGFNFEFPEAATQVPPTDSSSARYQSPQAAPAGFTYTPADDEIYVCPNCDEELRTGETDVERQVWAIKACGHAYCGQCAQNRSVTKNKKLKSPSKTKPFKQCVVDGCTSKTTGVKSMIQLYI